ncbi:divalent-cation tolerance protein CutA [bacterium]|nr:divalent-cation tolerance protein CutA [bacterium]
MTEAVVVLIACSGEAEADRIGAMLLKEQLAACVQRVSGVLSAFIWQGELRREEEVLLLVKTRRSLFRELSGKVSVIHTYDVPEIIALPVLDGNPAYLEWLKSTTK